MAAEYGLEFQFQTGAIKRQMLYPLRCRLSVSIPNWCD